MMPLVLKAVRAYERFCPLWSQTAQVLRTFCKQRQLDLNSDGLVFLNHRGEPLTRFGVRYLLRKHFEKAKAQYPELARKRLHPHSLRHSTAVALLKAGVDLTTISQWLGLASLNTTNKYAAIDLDLKRKALERVKPLTTKPKIAWRNNVPLLEWLDSL